MLAIELSDVSYIKRDGGLTRYGSRLPEDLGNLRINLNHEVFFDCDLSMPLINLLFDPPGELVLQDCCADVCYPLLGCLRELNLWIREKVVHFFVVREEEFVDFFDAEAFISKSS